NAAAIRAEGGYPIINHPVDGSSWAWNSKQATQGIEGDQMHGVEIWSGSTQSGQGGHVGDWVDWLLGGRILYCYSGSDTHDAAFAFGANHAVFEGESFTISNLEAALKAGRSFISNGHVLILEAEVDGVVLDMGTLQALSPNQPATSVTVRAHYNFGADTSVITIFRGAVGDPAETSLCQSGPLTGEGVFACNDSLDTVNRTWYRAYSEAGAKTAYTNPVFFLPGSCGFVPYGAGLGGANIATLSSVSSPTVGSIDALDVSGFDPSATSATLGLSNTQIPGGSPLLGGFLLIGLPALFTGNAPLSGGSGSFVFQIPDLPGIAGNTFYWQSVAFDPVFPGNLAFSNALAMAVCTLLQ
ncbi:MAG: hypothetical protein O7B99_08105, partial [Planctomycetota bacterium]|nr:hypothetical protein [Planctomycetota bacterium]